MKKIIFSTSFLLLFYCCSTFAMETLNVKFDAPKSVTVGTKEVKIAGNFSEDKMWGLGTGGAAFPAATLVGNAGTIAFSFKYTPFKDEIFKNRYMLSLRTASRASIMVWFTPNKPILRVSYSGVESSYTFVTKFPLEPDRVYQVAFSWDGNLFKVYLDGILQSEARQPEPFGKITNLNIGRYKDGYFDNNNLLPDDCFAGCVKTFDSVLTSDEILKLADVKIEESAITYSSVLVVPQASAAVPVADGVLEDKVWEYAAGMIGVIGKNKPANSWTLPSNSFKFLYDSDNLYLAATTIFPGRVSIHSGDVRTENKEPEVWGSESFELYLDIDHQKYRFGGNVAGGFCEMKGLDGNWNGKWEYKSSSKMRIDDTQLWVAEAIIPWRTLGLDGPPAKGLLFNFCRSWMLPEAGGASALSLDGVYANGKYYAKMFFGKNTPSMQVIRQSDPNDGDFVQDVQFISPVNAKVEYKILLAKLDGSAVPLEVSSKNIQLTANMPNLEKIVFSISQSTYDCMIFSLFSGKELLMRQIMPFKLNEEYFSVNPQFGTERLAIKVRNGLLKDKFGTIDDFCLLLQSPDGNELARKNLTGNELITFDFIRKNSAGNYHVALIDRRNQSIIARKEFFYPGIGEWESMKFDNRIIPPFTALKWKRDGEKLDVEMWGRTYQWDESSIFPAQIVSQKELLLTGAITLTVGGKSVSGGTITLGNTDDHRVEFTESLRNDELTISGKSWIEYDGVQYNSMKLKALKNLAQIKLKIPVANGVAKYLHTSDTGAWNTRITEKIVDGVRRFRYYPVIWLGKEEKGLCFFSESKKSLLTKEKNICQVVTQQDGTFLEITLADQVKSGEELSFDFGLLASPVKALPDNYPLNTFNWSHATLMNRPEKPSVSLHFQSAGLVNTHERAFVRSFSPAVAAAEKVHGRLIPYSLNSFMSNEYPEITAFIDEWKIVPEQALDYTYEGKKYLIYNVCPTTPASEFYISKYKQMLKSVGVKGLYLDFGLISYCNNNAHGCFERIPLLAQRELYRRMILAQLDAGIEEPVLILHNTDSVQLPAMTFATHLFNGEQIRQASSTMLHNGRDILDNYDAVMFASELNSLPFGLTNSVYVPADKLLPQNGGTAEDGELYAFRMTKAAMAGALVHNTMPSPARLHYGIFDKVLRCYQEFDVPHSEFLGYYKEPAVVVKGNNIYVSAYKNPKTGRVLAIISHIGKAHENQEIEIDFNVAEFGKLNLAIDRMTAEDPEYDELYNLREKNNIPTHRAPLKLGDFGSQVNSFDHNRLKMKLNYHSFAIIELSR